MRGRRKGSRGSRGGSRGSSSSGRGGGRGKKVTIAKAQKTLMDYYFQKPKEREPSPPKKEEEEITEEPEQNPFSEMETKLINLVKQHQLNEILINFQMADRFLLQFSLADMKYFYQVVQREMIEEFGAPLSPSLFPNNLFETHDDDDNNTQTQTESSKSLF